MIAYRIVVLFVLINCVFSKIRFDFGADRRACPGITDDLFDISDIEVIAVNDTLNVLNGIFKVVNEIRSPTIVQVTTKRLTRGQWINGELNRLVHDMCVIMRNPSDAFYTIMRHIKNTCPFKPGAEEFLDMIPITDFQLDIPKSMVGKWKIKILIMSGKHKSCFENDFEFVEDSEN